MEILISAPLGRVATINLCEYLRALKTLKPLKPLKPRRGCAGLR
jgi:hypothetical protein